MAEKSNNHHHHEAERAKPASTKPLKLALGLVVTIMVAEVVGGILSNSLALIGDAGHMLVDALALSLALFAMIVARRPATPTKTYGYHRAEILAAMANGTFLVLLAAWLFYEAYQRFQEPPHIQTPIMLIVAGIGLVANLGGILLLREGSHGHLNIKAAFWHILGDTISSVGVIITGIIITFTGWYIADPIIAILIGCIILWGAARIVREASDVLLEAVPKHIKIEKVVETLQNVPGVDEVHDMHIWTITSGIYALSTHLMIGDQMVSHSAEILQAVAHDLSENFNITHTTLQLECEKCESCPSGIICNISQVAESVPHA
jgi:cobalt-zinc-cadmium efflux system protein